MKKELISKKVLDAITPMLPKDCIRVFILSRQEGGKMLSDTASNLSNEDLRSYLRTLLCAMYEKAAKNPLNKKIKKAAREMDAERKKPWPSDTFIKLTKKMAKGQEKKRRVEESWDIGAGIKRGPGRPKGSKNKKA